MEKLKTREPHGISLQNFEIMRNHTMAFHSKISIFGNKFQKVRKSLTKLKIKSRIYNALQKKKSYEVDIYKYHRQNRKIIAES